MMAIVDSKTEDVVLRALEDIQMLMIDHPSVKMTMPLITSLSDNNIGVVFCNRSHMPVTMLMDLDSNVIQSKRFQKQLSASIPTNKQIGNRL